MTTHKYTISPQQHACITTNLVLKAVWCCFQPCFLKKKTEKKRKHRVKKQYQVNRIKNLIFFYFIRCEAHINILST
jgi:hypothetical protein